MTVSTNQESQPNSFRQRKIRFVEGVKAWPFSVFLILGNEFCERFSYAGLAVLTLYVRNVFGWSPERTIIFLSAYGGLMSLLPLLSSILSDGFIGKFHTILWLSLVHAAGNIILAVASGFPTGTSTHPYLDIFALMVLIIGTSGIKPCVAPFGAEQFRTNQAYLIPTYFSVFYFTINVGSVIGIFLGPIFRSFSCFGSDSCYPLAFGVAAGLMVVACGFFIVGTRFYTKVPAKGNVIIDSALFIKTAIGNKMRFSIKREHWLHHYLDTHICDTDKSCGKFVNGFCNKLKFAEDLRAILRLMVLYIPFPVYFALYTLPVSLWVFQGTLMDGRLGSISVLPDQISVVYPILVLILIPISTAVIYPLVNKCVKLTPLRKMCMGGMMQVLGYVIVGCVQLMVNDTMPILPDAGTINLMFVNNNPFSINATVDRTSYFVAPHSDVMMFNLPCKAECVINANFTNELGVRETSLRFAANGIYYGFLVDNGSFITHPMTYNPPLAKSSLGNGQFKLSLSLGEEQKNWLNGVVTLCKAESDSDNGCATTDSSAADQFVQVKSLRNYADVLVDGDILELRPGKWLGYLSNDSAMAQAQTKGIPDFIIDKPEWGGIYAAVLDTERGKPLRLYQVAPDSSVSLMWQLFPGAMLSIGEVLFSITGLELSYSQAPASMKSITNALWMVSAGLGSFVVTFFTATVTFSNPAFIYFFYSGIMAAVVIIFIFLAQFWFNYVSYETDENGIERMTSSKY